LPTFNCARDILLRNQSELTSLLKRLYDPASSDYHRFLSVADFTERFGPTAGDYQAVVDFAKAHGLTVTGTAVNRMLVQVSGTAAQIDSTFNVSMGIYQHPTEKRTFYSPDREPAIPSGLHVSHIVGLNNYSIPKPMLRRPPATGRTSAVVSGSGPGGYYLGSDMRAAYYGSGTLAGRGQSIALVQFDGYDISDVVESFNGAASASANGGNYVLSYTPPDGKSTYTIPINNVLLDGATGAPTSGNDSEEVLDVVQSVSMAPGLSQVRVYIGNSDADILNAIASDDAAKQVSISWSWLPEDPEVDDFFFEEMAAQGQSVFAASGDDGAFNTQIPNFFPAEDAYVTAVGGTSLTTTGPGGAWKSEVAWNGSGGGPSPDFIPIPSWQAGIATSANLASAVYRNVPDVAMEADFDNYDCNMGTCQGGWAGTSFAAPRWAGYMALVNEQAAAQGQAAIGFLNPLIYSIGQGPGYASTLHDINLGTDDLTGWNPYYYAVSGYDLVTGWGSPAGGPSIDVLAPGAKSGFYLALSLAGLKIEPGASATTTITVNASASFSGPVTLSAPGLPSGITVSFSSNPTSTSSVLTLSVDPAMTRGSFLLTIIGTANGNTAQSELAVEVDAPGFMLSGGNLSNGNPYVWITPGYADSLVLSISDFEGFSGAPTLSITSPLPSGVTAVLNPNATAASSVLTFIGDASASESAGNAIEITATSGAASDTRTVFLDVAPAQYRLTVTRRATYVARGTSVAMTVSTVPWGNYQGGAIDLSAFTAQFPLPAGVTVTFEPSTIQFGQTSIVTVTASPTAALGGFYASVVANVTNPDISPWEAFWLTVTAAPQPLFRVTVDPPYFALPQGGSFTDTMTVTDEYGFSGQVALQPPNPANLQLDIQEPDPVTGIGSATYNASNNIPPKLYSGAGYGAAYSDSSNQGLIDLWILVTPTTPFSLQTPIGTLNMAQGGSASATVSISRQNGFAGAVELSATGVPEGMIASFDSDVTSSDTVLHVSADPSVPAGLYYVNVSGSASGQTLVRTIPIQVNKAAVSFTVTPYSVTYDGKPHTAAGTATGAAGSNLSADLALSGTTHTKAGIYTNDAWSFHDPTGNYADAKGTITDVIAMANPAINWATPAAITYGTALSATQLNATPSVPGTLVYNPAAGTVPKAGQQTLSVTLAPTDAIDYKPATANITLTVHKAASSVTWSNPAAITYGAALSATQLNATSRLPGKFLYTPALGAVPGAGSQPLSVVFTPTDSIDYTSATGTVTLSVKPAALKVTANPASRAYGAANPAFTPGFTGFVNGDTAATSVTGSARFTTTAIATSLVGTYPITVAAGTLAAANYTLTFAPGSLTVTKTPLTVTATSASVPYNQAMPKFTYKVVGYRNGDAASMVTGAASETTSAKQGSAVGTYPITITQGTLAATNYSFLFQNGTLTVTSLGTTAAPIFKPVGGTYTSIQSVALTDATGGAVIYYTADGSTPTTSSTKYASAISVAATETIHAIAVAPGYTQSAAATAAYTINLPTAASPTFSVAGGTYNNAQTVTLATKTAGAAIYYTTNGTTPTAGSTKYTVPVKITSSETINAIAIATGYNNSTVATAAYTLQAAAPVFKPAAGTYTSAQSVTLTSATSGATIYYTTNGAPPTSASTKYTTAISVGATETINAIAVNTGYNNSAVATAAYTINLPAATPTFSPAAGTYTSVQTVTISDKTAKAAIYYTTNGTAPTTSSTLYTAPVTVGASKALKAVAIASGSSLSAVGSAAYTINLPTATPVISPVAGTYTAAQTVTIADATSGANIYFTTNGTTPTTASTRYTAAGIKVTATETIKAIAIATGYTTSAVASAAYTIATAPAVTTKAATVLSTAGATLNGTVTANNATTQYWFAYGTSKTPLTSTTTKTGALTGTTATPVSAALTGLKGKTTYYYRDRLNE
jgi:hypothetical protein